GDPFGVPEDRPSLAILGDDHYCAVGQVAGVHPGREARGSGWRPQWNRAGIFRRRVCRTALAIDHERESAVRVGLEVGDVPAVRAERWHRDVGGALRAAPVDHHDGRSAAAPLVVLVVLVVLLADRLFELLLEEPAPLAAHGPP